MITDSITSLYSRVSTQEQIRTLYNIIEYMIKQYDYYLAINENDAYFQINFSRLHIMSANFFESKSKEYFDVLNEARSVIDKCIELSPERLHNYYFLSNIDMMLGDGDKAIADLEYALKINSKYGATSWYLGGAYQSIKNDKDKSFEYFDKALNDNYYFSNLAEISKALDLYKNENGHIDQKINLYNQALNFTKSKEYYLELAKLYKEKGDFDNEKINLDKANNL